jgi:hypothetical protein
MVASCREYLLQNPVSGDPGTSASDADKETYLLKVFKQATADGQTCVNRAMGRIWHSQPGNTTAAPLAVCEKYCFEATAGTTDCFNCLRQNNKCAKAETAVECNLCRGENIESVDKLYRCITGKFPLRLSTEDIVLIATFVPIFLVSVGVIIYFTKFSGRKKPSYVKPDGSNVSDGLISSSYSSL